MCLLNWMSDAIMKRPTATVRQALWLALLDKLPCHH